MIYYGKVDCEPGEAGYDPGVLHRLDSHFRQLIDKKSIDAAAYLLARGGRVFVHRAIGKRPDSRIATEFMPDSIRPIFSVTKVILFAGFYPGPPYLAESCINPLAIAWSGLR